MAEPVLKIKRMLQICNLKIICNIYVFGRKNQRKQSFIYLSMNKEVKKEIIELIMFGMIIAK